MGSVFIEWKDVFAKLFSTSAIHAKPAGMTDEEYAQHVEEIWDAASEEARSAVIAISYIRQFLTGEA